MRAQVSVKREIHIGLLKPIAIEGFNLSFDYYLFYLKDRIFSKAVTAFLAKLAEFGLLSNSGNIRQNLAKIPKFDHISKKKRLIDSLPKQKK